MHICCVSAYVSQYLCNNAPIPILHTREFHDNLSIMNLDSNYSISKLNDLLIIFIQLFRKRATMTRNIQKVCPKDVNEWLQLTSQSIGCAEIANVVVSRIADFCCLMAHE